MRSHTLLRSSVAGLAALALLAPTLSPSEAAPAQAAPGDPVTLASGLVTPLSLAVKNNGVRYFSQNFAGQLMRQAPGGEPRVVYRSRGGAEVGAVSATGRAVTFATTSSDGKQTALMRLRPGGGAVKVADLDRYERRANPDGRVSYGFERISDACAEKLPEFIPAQYDGIVESHPYASTSRWNRTWVADAAANAVLTVKRGKVETLAVLPPVPVEITREAAEANGLPACTAGKTYRFESVPTDVEMGPDKRLYVTALPGGPEDGSTGAQGRVFRIHPRTGVVKLMAKGMIAATGLAVARDGTIYVAELFGGKISQIARDSSRPRRLVGMGLPGDVEISRGRLYATADVLSGLEPGSEPAGRIVRVPRG